MNAFAAKSSAFRLMASLACALALALCLSASGAYANEAGEYSYSIKDDGTIKITGYAGSDETLSVPAVLDGYTVSEIAANAFRDNDVLVEVDLPDCVTAIGASAFYDCSLLETVDFPANLESIGASAFKSCGALWGVVCPGAVGQIGNYAFQNCVSLTSFGASEGSISIGGSAFRNCETLEYVIAPGGIDSVGAYAFDGCVLLESVSNLNEGMTEIPEKAFYECGLLTLSALPSTVETIGTRAFGACASLTSVSLPEALSVIEGDAFMECEKLVSVEFPDGLTTVEASAFKDCSSLKTASLPQSISSLEGSVFEGCTSLTALSLPSTIEEIPAYLCSGCTSLQQADIPHSVKVIGNSAYENCSSLTSVTAPARLESVEAYAFRGCSSVVEFRLDDVVNEEISFGKVCLSGFADDSYIVVGTRALYDTLASAGQDVYSTDATTVVLESAFLGGAAVYNVFDSTYTGKVIEPEVSVKLNGVELQEGQDYQLEFRQNVNAGTAYIVIEGINDYAGKKTVTFRIKPMALSATKAGSVALKTYTGSAIKPKPTVKRASDGVALVLSRDYSLSYKNNVKSGKATITVKGKGNYTGMKTVVFKIRPAKVLNVKASSPSKGKVYAKWSSTNAVNANASGYKVVIKSGTKTVKTGWVTSKYTKGKTLAVPAKYKGKKVTVRVYAYKTIDGTKWLSPVSAVKTVKVKG